MPPQDTSRGNRDEVHDCQQHSRGARCLTTTRCVHGSLGVAEQDDGRPGAGRGAGRVRRTVSPRKLRQFLFANALYTNALRHYRMGNMNREEFFGFMPWPAPPRTRTSGGLWVSPPVDNETHQPANE
ncbi:DUF6082 family protein [Streptomyces coeruleorubidus]|uniref:DUF6082 family protein n=1 Tax=Streptomyces coeruleorubidus TaxID=116188 RepID=UPI001E61E107|nr:DUF6082 family protein [Streptomyces bellus]